MNYYLNFDLESIHYVDEFGEKRIEEWKDIIGYEGLYQVSNLGRYKSFCRFGNFHLGNGNDSFISKQTFNKDKYLTCALTKKNKMKTITIHRLVAIHFIPNPENKPEVNHDTETGDKTKNMFWLLKWATTKENSEHAWKNGLIVGRKGMKHPISKLTDKEVLEIRSKYIPRIYTLKMLSEEYGIKRTSLSYIIKRKTWKHI